MGVISNSRRGHYGGQTKKKLGEK